MEVHSNDDGYDKDNTSANDMEVHSNDGYDGDNSDDVFEELHGNNLNRVFGNDNNNLNNVFCNDNNNLNNVFGNDNNLNNVFDDDNNNAKKGQNDKIKIEGNKKVGKKGKDDTIKPNHNKRWTEDEEKKAKEAYIERVSLKKIAKMLGRTESAIRNKVCRKEPQSL